MGRGFTLNVSIILTVLNEAGSIGQLLDSISRQTMLPNEVIIVDAGSTDHTLAIIDHFSQHNPSLSIVAKVVPGNRSVGRNAAIRLARNEYIVCTDAGCTLDLDWLQKITEPFTQSPPADFVGGWYQPLVVSAWDMSLAAVLGFDAKRVNTKTFLPSTRSMAFQKTLWGKVGGFNEQNSHSEDTPFSRDMRTVCTRFAFVPDAVVHWSLVQTYDALYRTIARYSLGDGEQRLWMSQYRLLSIGALLAIGFAIMGFLLSPLAWLVAAICLLGYLYLPLVTSQYPRRASSFYQVPLMKAMLITGNLFGFYRGLFRQSTSTSSTTHNSIQP